MTSNNLGTGQKSAHILEAGAIRTLLEDYLKDYFEYQYLQAQAVDKDYADLWSALEAVTLVGGKRLRPYLMLLSYAGCGGTGLEDVLPVATGLELIHQALLVHDDIIDRDMVRHGYLNVTGRMRQKYSLVTKRPGHHSMSAALLGGDLLLSAGYELIINNVSSKSATTRIINRLTQSLFQVATGQLLDSESTLPSHQVEPLKIARYKTASYTFILPLVCGAELANAPDTIIQALETYGERIGTAYQVSDDVLGTFGDPKRTGKSNMHDIREGKQTLLTMYARQAADKQQLKILSASLGNPRLTKQQADQVRHVMRQTGALHKVEVFMDELLGQATEALTSAAVDSALYDELIAIAHQAIQRNA